MSHDLDPIRTLYGEASVGAPGAPALDAASRAEVEALAPVCAALDHLAPISPPADTVAAVLAMARREATDSPAEAEDASVDLAVVRALYDESPPVTLSIAARAEADALAPVHTALGQLAPISPPADAVAAVLAMAHREATDSPAEVDETTEKLAAICALYDESPPAALSDAARAEADALAPVRDALGQLAPISPSADTVAAVLAMARREAASPAEADEEAVGLAAVRALYDESPPVALSIAARAEADALAPIRTALDQLSPISPPADTVAAVLAMARREAEADRISGSSARAACRPAPLGCRPRRCAPAGQPVAPPVPNRAAGARAAGGRDRARRGARPRRTA